ncbi:MAG TPA: helix-turn-helix domain-containing protein [Longimicrobium sp.]|jgi:AraC-like DNA-binding protein|uniref:AraC family transcriptional regulator n=1 Tax=Longimicrobium sp. TaxID=2029185 RepID=UPI002EDAC5D5
MLAPTRPLLVMHTAPGLSQALREACDDPARVWPMADWEALERAMDRVPPTAIAIVDPFDAEGGPPSPRLEALLAGMPSATVVAAFTVTAQTARHVDTLARWGVADVIDVGREDTPVALRQRLRKVQGRLAARLLERALPRSTPTRTRSLLAVAADTAATGGGSTDLAAALGVTERTVLRWCIRADLPQPRRLLAWLRVLLAADMLDDPGRTLAAVAAACGYSSDTALRNTLRTFLAASPTELRGQAFQTASGAFARELFTLRDAAHARGRPERTWLH